MTGRGERMVIEEKVRVYLAGGKSIPLARFEREDGQPRTHHPKCPTHPGEPLGAHDVCCDCIYGALEARR